MTGPTFYRGKPAGKCWRRGLGQLVLFGATPALLVALASLDLRRPTATPVPPPVPLQPAAVAVAPGVYLLGTLTPTAAYVVDTTDGLVLIDSGLEADEAFFNTFYKPSIAPHPTRIDVELVGDETLTFGEVHFRALATPGSISYLMEREGLTACSRAEPLAARGPRPRPEREPFRTRLGESPRPEQDAVPAVRQAGRVRAFAASSGRTSASSNSRVRQAGRVRAFAACSPGPTDISRRNR